jgi:hypothetical protein
MAKKKIVIPAFFPFWKDNLTTGLFTLEPDKLKRKYSEYLKLKENNWIIYYGSYQCMCAFIGDSEDCKGLQSVGDNDLYPAMEEVLHPVYMEFLK